MVKMPRVGLVLAVTLPLAVQLGCQSPAYFGGTSAQPPGITGLSDQQAQTVQRQQQLIAQASPAANNKPSMTSRIGNAIAAPFKSMGSSLSDAMTIQPKVVPPNDPTRLSSSSGEIGPDLHVSYARLAESQGNSAKAEEQYRLALAMDAKNIPALIGYGRLLHREGKVAEATGMYGKALQADPKCSVAMNDLAMLQARNGRIPEAADMLSRAVKLEPNSKLYRNNLATVLVEAGRSEEAYQHLLAVHGEAVAHYNLGYLLKERGQTAEAIQHLQLAQRIAPSLSQAGALLAQLQASGPARGGAPGQGPTLNNPAPQYAQPSPAFANPVAPQGSRFAQPVNERGYDPNAGPDYYRPSGSPSRFQDAQPNFQQPGTEEPRRTPPALQSKAKPVEKPTEVEVAERVRLEEDLPKVVPAGYMPSPSDRAGAEAGKQAAKVNAEHVEADDKVELQLPTVIPARLPVDENAGELPPLPE